ncbi:hypothetical protein KUCAC02_032848 [Chaenocephalus aceratus]|nr:hypothetical protein KUCAC02_032848 [Chaenocephalus aceratus]
MENVTMVTPLKQPIVFELEGFYVPPGYGAFLFVLALCNYMVMLFANGVVLCIIVIDKNLHRPMFVMVCNLVVCDLLGGTTVLPRFMVHFLTGQKKIAYISAIAQAFCVHTYGFAMQTILGVMAYDRYIAVCEPLRYHAIMTSARLHSCCALAWATAVICIVVLFAFHVNAPLCGNTIKHVYCSNRAILNLACSPTPLNNIYGLSMTWCVNTSVFLIIALSYLRILHATVKQGRDARRKAFLTCAPHLVVLMENYTYNSLTLQLEGLNVSKEYLYPVFMFIFFFYLFIIVTNVSIAVLIFIDKNLHQPMYLLFCNLPFNDILGNSIVVPRLLMDMLKPPSERLIGYHECVLQAFTAHMFGTATHTVLIIMAIDRYVAICNPLRYAAIMTNKMVIKLTVSAWGVALVLVGILLGLTIRLNRCRTMITNPFCDNASLFKLSCESVFINNVYGLTFTVVLFTASIGTMVITYTKITVVCLTSKSKSLNSKALKTCSTHLVLFLIMIFSGMSVITLHRFPQYSNYRKYSTILFHIVPGSLNPIIYGVQSKEIRTFLANSFKSKKVWPLC